MEIKYIAAGSSLERLNQKYINDKQYFELGLENTLNDALESSVFQKLHSPNHAQKWVSCHSEADVSFLQMGKTWGKQKGF